MPARIAGACGLLAFVTATVGWVAGSFAQPAAYSFARDDISDLGAITAASPWLYNQVGANLTGLLVAGCALGLWKALSPSVLGRLGAAALLLAGVGSFLDGLFRLDCRGIDAACTNHTWHSHAHKIESGFTAAFTLVAPLLTALAFRRIPSWRGAWAATGAGTVVFCLWVAFVGWWLLREPAQAAEPATPPPAQPATP